MVYNLCEAIALHLEDEDMESLELVPEMQRQDEDLVWK